MNSVAKAAGVSVATVDRVLNSRLSVKVGTADRVILAAQKVGYHATELMRRRLLQRAPVRTLGFCLQKAADPFYQSLAAALRQAAAAGFRSYFREHAPGFRVLEAHTNLEDQHLAHETVLELLAAHPDLAGLCVAGGGMAGVVRAWREEMPEQGLIVVFNELIAETRSGLIDGIVDLVIATPLERLASAAVQAMTQACDDGAAAPGQPGPAPLPFALYTPESV